MVSDHVDSAGREEDDPDVYRTLRMYWDQNRYEFPQLDVRQRFALEAHNARELRRHLDEFDPDVVSWWSMGCMSLALIEQVRRRGLPAVFIVHDDWLVYGRVHDQWMRAWGRTRWRRMLRPIVARISGVPTTVDLQNAGSFAFNSRYTLEQAREVGISAPERDVLYPGIDERFFERLPSKPWRWRLLYVGRLDRQKGVDTAVEALAYLPPTARLSVWGSGDERYVADMRALAARIGAADRVSFGGFVGAQDLRGVYEEADVVVFPVRWQEPFGLVPLEGMALGRPVVTTARGGSAEYVRDGQNALVFSADDPADLARCVDQLGRDAALRSRLVEGGWTTAARYPAQRFAERAVERIVRAGSGGPEQSDVASAQPALSQSAAG